MKSKQLLLIFFITAILGCSRETNTDLTKEQKLKIKIESVIASTSSDQRIQTYNLLTSEEMYILWKDHLQKAKTQFIASGKTQKVNLINDILANFTSSIFDDSHAEEVFFNYYVPVWRNSAESVFSPVELYDICFEPNVSVIGELRVVMEDEPDSGPAPKCFCHAGESGFSCRRIQLGHPFITNGICERTNASCIEKARGCGWFWRHSCDGNHCQF